MDKIKTLLAIQISIFAVFVGCRLGLYCKINDVHMLNAATCFISTRRDSTENDPLSKIKKVKTFWKNGKFRYTLKFYKTWQGQSKNVTRL